MPIRGFQVGQLVGLSERIRRADGEVRHQLVIDAEDELVVVVGVVVRSIVFGEVALVGRAGSTAFEYCGPRLVRISFFCANPSLFVSTHL